MASTLKFDVEIFVSSAKDLKGSWLHRSLILNPYVVVWVDPNYKCSTKIHENGGRCPRWDETLVIPLSSAIREDSTLFIHILDAEAESGTNPFIGRAHVKLRKFVDDFGIGKFATCSLQLRGRSGRSKGMVEVSINVRNHVPSSPMIQIRSEFSAYEIEEATRSFDPSLMIGQGRYGSVYRGLLRNTHVAIKCLGSINPQGHAEFKQEVDVLRRARHPNLVNLIGACVESRSLIYEYIPNGSLEDRLVCKGNTAPLPWQRRLSIAMEVCSALIFLHSTKPSSIIHGDIKPENILLDANMVSKLGDFGLFQLASMGCNSIDTTIFGTLGYMDPEFIATEQLSTTSDVYAFGVVLLRLLTGKPAQWLVNDVQEALGKGKLKTILDADGGWPVRVANQLTHLAMWCCESDGRSRPDLKSEVLRELTVIMPIATH